MKILYPLYFISFLNSDIMCQSSNTNCVTKNEMLVRWSYQGELIQFELSAPTKGWLAIGFNEKPTLSGAYLLMGRITKSGAELTEHYTISHGNYQSIESLGGEASVYEVSGKEVLGKSTVKFSIPINQQDLFRKDLSKGSTYQLIMAFSQADDFQHHSIMRTSIEVVL